MSDTGLTSAWVTSASAPIQTACSSPEEILQQKLYMQRFVVIVSVAEVVKVVTMETLELLTTERFELKHQNTSRTKIEVRTVHSQGQL